MYKQTEWTPIDYTDWDKNLDEAIVEFNTQTEHIIVLAKYGNWF